MNRLTAYHETDNTWVFGSNFLACLHRNEGTHLFKIMVLFGVKILYNQATGLSSAVYPFTTLANASILIAVIAASSPLLP